MGKLFIVTNRKLCKRNFLVQIEAWAKAGANAIVLREKDLPANSYKVLAKEFLAICKKHKTIGILHTHYNLAIDLKAEVIHLPLPIFKKIFSVDYKKFPLSENKHIIRGVSVHTKTEAKEAYELGADYLLLGNIFETDCKKGLPGIGLQKLQQVAESVPIPVYAIGGVTYQNFDLIIKSKAQGAAIMSSAMICESPELELAKYLNYCSISKSTKKMKNNLNHSSESEDI